MTIYLYKKTHNITGLSYLGKTTQDPFKYPGSGKYWLRHLQNHGNDVTTMVLKECQSNDEVKECGIFYSHQWNVVESDLWANLKPEEGDGMTSTTAKIINNDQKKKKDQSNQMISSWGDDSFRKNREQQIREFWDSDEGKIKSIERGENRRGKSNKRSKKWDDPVFRDKVIKRGKNHPKYDHTIYTFVHDSGIVEYCTRQELIEKYNLDQASVTNHIKGNYKSTKGWRVIK